MLKGEQIKEKEDESQAKYITGEMISSRSDNQAGGPMRGHSEREPMASINTSCLTTESHEMRHDLFPFTKTGEHFVLFGWTVCVKITRKKEQNLKKNTK